MVCLCRSGPCPRSTLSRAWPAPTPPVKESREEIFIQGEAAESVSNKSTAQPPTNTNSSRNGPSACAMSSTLAIFGNLALTERILPTAFARPCARGQHPQGVHREGRQIRFQSKTGRSLHRRGCTKGRQSTTQQAACGIDTKGLKPQQHTQGPLLHRALISRLPLNKPLSRPYAANG